MATSPSVLDNVFRLLGFHPYINTEYGLQFNGKPTILMVPSRGHVRMIQPKIFRVGQKRQRGLEHYKIIPSGDIVPDTYAVFTTSDQEQCFLARMNAAFARSAAAKAEVIRAEQPESDVNLSQVAQCTLAL